MRRSLVWSLTLLVAAITLCGVAIGASSTVSYQGRLTNSSGTPVADGSYSVTFSLWTDLVGGTMIWSETQNVPVSGGGLFSTQLGNIQPLGGALIIHGESDLYLETSVSGTPLVPRIALGTVPNAFSSSSVNHTVPGNGSVHIGVGDDTTKITATHESFSNLIDSYVHLTDDRALLGLKSYNPSLDYIIGDATEINGKLVRNYLDLDDDADGIPDIVEELSVQPGTATLNVSSSKRRFNLLDAFPQRFRVIAHDSDTASSVSSALESDADADGVAEGGIWEKVDNTEALSVVGVDVDEDGIPDVGTSSSAKLPRSVLKTFFERGDKPTQSQIVDSVDENGATSGVIRYEGSDFEGFQVSLMPDSAVVSTEVSNPSGSSSSRMRTRINELESRLQSIGLLARTSSSSSLTPDSVTELTEAQGASTKARRLVFVSGSVGDGSLVEINSLDSDGNGVPEQISEQVVNEDSVSYSQRIQAGSNIHLNLHLYNASDKALMDMGYDGDGDGFPEQEISSSIVPTRSQHAINTKGTGAQGGRSASISAETTVDSALQEISIDDDGDGIPESTDRRVISSNDVHHNVMSRGGSTTATIRTMASPDSVVSVYEQDSDGDGIPDARRLVLVSGSHGSVSRVQHYSGGVLNGEASTEVGATESRQALKKEFQNGDIPTQEDFVNSIGSFSRAINTKGTGATFRVVSEASDSALTVLDYDDDGDGVSESSVRTRGNVTYADVVVTKTLDNASTNLRMAATGDSAVLVIGYDGTTSSTLSLRAASTGATDPIEHSSGAHLTSGGVWTNASDENLKENFQPVDGTELLEKIDQLPISEWNYKTESDDVKHIGPTAQDFQATFGVGSDGKSISTIDPSGIALAAIKELNKQNQLLQKQSSELRDQNEQLRKELNELKAMIEKVASRK